MSKGNTVQLQADVRDEFTRLLAECFAKMAESPALYTARARKASL